MIPACARLGRSVLCLLPFAGLAALHASPAAQVPGKTVLEVSAFGAMGNFMNDDTVAIQTALNAAKDEVQRAGGSSSSKGVQVYFREGIYKVTSTLQLDNSAGIELAGAGFALVDVRDPGQRHPYQGILNGAQIYNFGASTAIVAVFDKPQPLFSFTGQVGHRMHDMTLFGCPGALMPESSGWRANCTALVATASLGWGNSLNKYDGLVLRDAVKGFLLGSDSGSDGNNDLLVFERIGADLVDVVFQQQTPQSVGLLFEQIVASSCKTVFDFDNPDANGFIRGGGCVSVDTLSMTGCGGTGPEDWCIKVAGQVNTGAYTFRNVRAETADQLLGYLGQFNTRTGQMMKAYSK